MISNGFYNYHNLKQEYLGEVSVQNWTFIADNNPPRNPDDWNVGDVIRLPKIIVRDIIR